MVHAKNCKTMSTFVKVMQKKLWPLFFPDTVYLLRCRTSKCIGGSGEEWGWNKKLHVYIFGTNLQCKINRPAV